MTRIKLTAWIASVIVLGLGIFVARAKAQEMPPKTYMHQNVFYLPVKIEDRVRPGLREVQLYAKDNRSVRLATIIYARSNGVDLTDQDIDTALNTVLNPDNPDLGPALVRAFEKFSKGT